MLAYSLDKKWYRVLQVFIILRNKSSYAYKNNKDVGKHRNGKIKIYNKCMDVDS